MCHKLLMRMEKPDSHNTHTHTPQSSVGLYLMSFKCSSPLLCWTGREDALERRWGRRRVKRKGEERGNVMSEVSWWVITVFMFVGPYVVLLWVVKRIFFPLCGIWTSHMNLDLKGKYTLEFLSSMEKCNFASGFTDQGRPNTFQV